MYKQIAEIRTEADIEAVRAELLDRYGEPPAPVEALLGVARLRNLAREQASRRSCRRARWSASRPWSSRSRSRCG